MDSKIVNALVDFGRHANLMDVMGYGKVPGLTGESLAFILACKNGEDFMYRMSDGAYIGATYLFIAWSLNLESKRFAAALRTSFEKGETPESLIKLRDGKNDKDFWRVLFEFVLDYSYKAWQDSSVVPDKAKDNNVV